MQNRTAYNYEQMTVVIRHYIQKLISAFNLRISKSYVIKILWKMEKNYVLFVLNI